MDITIIGTGNMARGIATRALEGGQNVTLLGTERRRRDALAQELPGEVRAGQVGDPLAGEVVVLAVWYQAVPDVLARYGDQLDGKVVVDITNPVDPETYAPLNIEAGSVAQEIATTVPGAKVVKAFNTTFAGTLVAGQVAGTPLDVFMASDDDEAKKRPAARRRRRPARDRRRPARARAPARGRRLPQHGRPARPRHQLRQRAEDRRLARATSTSSAPVASGRGSDHCRSGA